MNRPPRIRDPKEREYLGLIKGIAERARAWITAHPEAKPLVQFNFTTRIFLIAPIEDALARHYISTNADGLAMLHAAIPNMGAYDEPTVMMTKTALEHLEEICPPPMRCPSCAMKVDVFTGMRSIGSTEEPQAEPGSVIVCAYCHTFNTLTDDRRALRNMEIAELAAIPSDSPAWALLAVLKNHPFPRK